MGNILGIDPGKKGAAVVVAEGNPVVAIEFSKLLTEYPRHSNAKPFNLLNSEALKESFGKVITKETIAVIEIPLALPGLANQAIATTYANWGILLGVVSLLVDETKIILVEPKAWAIGMHQQFARHPFDPDNKKKSRECFDLLWPKAAIKPTEGSVDAALIAFYYRLRKISK
jgi:hypothetical protein